jgi:hypothetical protein
MMDLAEVVEVRNEPGEAGADTLDATDGSDVMDDVDGGPDAGDEQNLCYRDEADVFTDSCNNQ